MTEENKKMSAVEKAAQAAKDAQNKDGKKKKADKKDEKKESVKDSKSASSKSSKESSKVKKESKKPNLFKKKDKSEKDLNKKVEKESDKKNKKSKKEKKDKKKRSIFSRKKKAPKLVDNDLQKKKKEKPKKSPAQKKQESRLIKRSVWVVVLCLLVGGGIITGFNMAGKMAPNAGLAARVDDYDIKEDDVTSYIKTNTYYANYSKSASDWGKFLSTYGMTPTTFRKQVIEDKFIEDELIRRAAEVEEITADEEKIDEHIDSLKGKYKSDSAYKNALEKMGYTEDTYREYVRTSMLKEDLQNKVAPETEPSDADMVSYMQTNKSTYSGAKRTSHILFGLGDKDKAQSVLDQINAGTLSFEDAVTTYSTDTDTKDKGGDMGWDKCNSNLASEYTSAISSLSTGQVATSIVQTTSGYHIIKVTDQWTAPDTITDVSQVPTDILSYCRDKKKSSDQDTSFSNYLESFKTDNNIVVDIYDMPEDVPYNIDMDKYGTSSAISGSNVNASNVTTNADGSVTYSG